jgi:putative transposase
MIFAGHHLEGQAGAAIIPPYAVCRWTGTPNLNPPIERFMKGLNDEALEKMMFFGEKMLRTAIRQFLEHYHAERNHQGLGNQLTHPGEEVGQSLGEVQCRERLGGLLRYYYRDAA